MKKSILPIKKNPMPIFKYIYWSINQWILIDWMLNFIIIYNQIFFFDHIITELCCYWFSFFFCISVLMLHSHKHTHTHIELLLFVNKLLIVDKLIQNWSIIDWLINYFVHHHHHHHRCHVVLFSHSPIFFHRNQSIFFIFFHQFVESIFDSLTKYNPKYLEFYFAPFSRSFVQFFFENSYKQTQHYYWTISICPCSKMYTSYVCCCS